ncbi:uncharacterized protein [Dysidea avara]|uniref:uncharacterized protein n=1 Tax=Dysidea avara TaxID=196820 RepID=UPI00331A4960
MKQLAFYYDVVCPFAYVASTLVEQLAVRNGVRLEWKPVLLAGINNSTKEKRVMTHAKREIVAQDLLQLARRYGVHEGARPLVPACHPHTTQYAMTLLAFCPDMLTRSRLTHSLYKAYWRDGMELTDLKVLQQLANNLKWEVNVSHLVESGEATALLESITGEALEHGTFSLPSFWLGDRLFWGVDRMFLMERHLGNRDAVPLRLTSPKPGKRKLTFYLDYSSPWSYLATMQLDTLIRSLQPMKINVEYVPIHQGALFKEIGTMEISSENRRRYLTTDIQDWASYYGVPLLWPSTFPIRTVQPLRVTIAGGSDPRLIKHLYKAVWQDDKNIGDELVLQQVLQHGGFDSKHLMEKSVTSEVRNELWNNTRRAIDVGVCGVPSFQVNDGMLVWGQDRLNVVADMLCSYNSTE